MSWFSNIVSGIGNVLSSVPVVGDIAQGISSAVSGIEAEKQHERDKAWSAEQAQLNRDFQREERLVVQNYNEKMWHMNNEYNSPANQIKLAREAGINPGSLFGNSSGGFVSADPSKSTASAGSMANSPGSLAAQMLTGSAQVASLLEDAQAKNISNEFAPVFNDAALKRALAEIGKIGADRGFTEAQTIQLKEMLPLLKDKTTAEIDELMKKSAQLVQQTSLLLQETDKAEAEKIIAKAKANFAALYGVNPDSNPISMLVQSLLSGDKGRNIVNALLTTLTSLAKGLTIDTYDRSKANYEEALREGHVRGRQFGEFLKELFK